MIQAHHNYHNKEHLLSPIYHNLATTISITTKTENKGSLDGLRAKDHKYGSFKRSDLRTFMT